MFATVTLSITRCCAWRRTQKLSADCNPEVVRWLQPFLVRATTIQIQFCLLCGTESNGRRFFGLRRACELQAHSGCSRKDVKSAGFYCCGCWWCRLMGNGNKVCDLMALHGLRAIKTSEANIWKPIANMRKRVLLAISQTPQTETADTFRDSSKRPVSFTATIISKQERPQVWPLAHPMAVLPSMRPASGSNSESEDLEVPGEPSEPSELLRLMHPSARHWVGTQYTVAHALLRKALLRTAAHTSISSFENGAASVEGEIVPIKVWALNSEELNPDDPPHHHSTGWLHSSQLSSAGFLWRRLFSTSNKRPASNNPCSLCCTGCMLQPSFLHWH